VAREGNSSGEPAPSTERAPFTSRTAWARNLETPLRMFLRTESGSAMVLLAGVAAALIWANADLDSYTHVWERTTLSIQLGGTGLSHTLRYWVNSGLMTFFFFVIGLEARREFDLGELRERRRTALPLAAGIGGMVVPIAIYLAFNAGGSAAHAWGTAMSTDTAFALGLLALVGARFPFRLRAFMLTFSVVDDVAALVVIATAYASGVDGWALLEALGIYAVVVLLARARVTRAPVYTVLGVAGWIALSHSGVDPIVIGLAMGLLTWAAPRRGATSSARPTSSGSSANSRPRSSREPRPRA
jgi:Na+/H+ antiporter NhaA